MLEKVEEKQGKTEEEEDYHCFDMNQPSSKSRDLCRTPPFPKPRWAEDAAAAFSFCFINLVPAPPRPPIWPLACSQDTVG